MNRRNSIWKAILAGMVLISTGRTVYAEEPDPSSPPPVTEEAPEETEAPAPEELSAAEPTETPDETLSEEQPESVTEPSEAPEPAEPVAPSAEPEETAEPEPVWSERLIVIGGEIRDQDHVISAYEDLTLLGFADNDALQEGYAYYSVHAAHAEADGIILAAENGDLTDAPNEISSENNTID